MSVIKGSEGHEAAWACCGSLLGVDSCAQEAELVAETPIHEVALSRVRVTRSLGLSGVGFASRTVKFHRSTQGINRYCALNSGLGK